MDETTNTIDLTEQQEQSDATQLTVVSTINNLYAEAEALSNSAKEYANKAVEVALKLGNLLVIEKRKVGHGNWQKWVENNLDFSYVTSTRYMKLANKNNEISERAKDDRDTKTITGVIDLERAKVKSLRQAYIATGILPEAPKPNKEDNFSECFNQKNVRYVKHIDKAVASLRTIFEDDPLSQWTLQRQKALMLNLKPLVAIHEELENLEITLP